MAQQTLHDFVLNLLTDQQAMSAFQLDPEASLMHAGLDDITPQDVQEAIPLVIDYADGTVAGGFTGSLDGVAGSGAIDSPTGLVAAGGAVAGQDGVAGAFGVESPLGSAYVAGAPAGLNSGLAPDFSVLTDLGDSLDADLLALDPTAAVVDTIAAGAGLAAGGLTGGANSAASLLTAGASATAGLVGTGANLAMNTVTDPVGATKAVVGSPDTLTDTLTDTVSPALPADGMTPVAGMPVVTDAQPDVVHDVVHQAPAGGLVEQAGLPRLDSALNDTLDSTLNDTLDTVDDTHGDLLDVVDQGPVGQVLGQTPAGDLVSDVVGQSPVSDVISLSQPGGATGLVRDVVSLDDALGF